MPVLSVTYDGTSQVFTVTNGQVIDASQIPGNWSNANKRIRAEELVQKVMDHWEVQNELPVDDPERTMTDAQLQAIYDMPNGVPRANGQRKRFLTQEAGVTYIVSRVSIVKLDWVNNALSIHISDID